LIHFDFLLRLYRQKKLIAEKNFIAARRKSKHSSFLNNISRLAPLFLTIPCKNDTFTGTLRKRIKVNKVPKRKGFFLLPAIPARQKGTLLNKFVIFVATGGYVGFFPVAPGTAGALVGLLFCYLFSHFSWPLYLLSTVALCFLGVWAADRAEIIFASKDSPRIVIDEIAGYLLTMFLSPFSPGTALVGFVFFRLFDIIKPPPARKIDRRMEGGLAVVLDDVVAGIYANLFLRLFLLWRPEFLQEADRWVRLIL
jgi:phosphatidylglycerophosphatase A